MFEILLSNYRLPRANYTNVFGNALVFDAKLFHMHLLRGTMVVQDEKSIHFRVLGGTYLSHDEKSIALRNVIGTFVANDPQFNRHAAVSMTYMTEDQQSFSLFSVDAHAVINDGNGGLDVARNFADYVVDDQMMRIGIVSARTQSTIQQQGVISMVTNGQVCVPTIEHHTVGIVTHISAAARADYRDSFGVGTHVGNAAIDEFPKDSMAPFTTVGQVAVRDNYIGSIFDPVGQ